MSYGLKVLISVFISIICCSFAFKVAEAYLNRRCNYFYNNGFNIDYSLFREHQSRCSTCSACVYSDDLNSRPCEEGLKIMFLCSKERELERRQSN
jgi:hypothetical protein